MLTNAAGISSGSDATGRPLDLSSVFFPFDIASRHSVIAAVSGGSDSTALLLLLKDWLDANAPQTKLTAVTIDHDLRPGSAGEARQVGDLCATLGVAHRVVRWQGAKPIAGLPAAARDARYDLLSQAAHAERTDLVFTGHTADDQAETLVMRRARQNGAEHGQGRGMAGMAPLTLFDGDVWIARPLLDQRRETLRDHLRSRDQGWIDDPTNTDTRYERPRLRLSGIEDATALLTESARQADRRLSLGEQAARLIEAHAACPQPGLVRLPPAFFRAAPSEAAVYALRILLAAMGGMAPLPPKDNVSELARRLGAGETFRVTLSRALLDSRRAGIFILREARDLPSLAAAEGKIWDRRHRLLGPDSGAQARPETFAETSGQPMPDSLLRLAEQTSPLLPPGWKAVPVLAPWLRFLPSFDLAPARAMAALVGAPEIPVPPWRRHIDHDA